MNKCTEKLANGELCGNSHLISNGKCSIHWAFPNHREMDRLNKVSNANRPEGYHKVEHMAQHTPTPWIWLGADETYSKQVEIQDEESGAAVIARLDETGAEADAAFIVRAVNCHERLVMELKALIENVEGKDQDSVPYDDIAIKAVKDLIAKAEGK